MNSLVVHADARAGLAEGATSTELITGEGPARRTDGVLVLRSESAAPTRPYAVGLVETRRACPGSCKS